MAEITHEQVATNGVELHVATAGPADGPPVVLCHGFPELWYSWRHQLGALGDAGYRAFAPDLRGYGGSSAPKDVAAYGSDKLTGDLCGLLDHYGYETAAFSGHDWGAMVVWEMGRLHPERVASIYAMSVPYSQAPGPPTEIFRHIFGDKFFYMLYFQDVGPAEAEFDANPRLYVRTMMYSAGGEGMAKGPALLGDVPAKGTKFLDILQPAPDVLPAWLTEDDVDVYTEGLTRQRPVRPAQLLPQPRCQLGPLQGPARLAVHDAHRLPHRVPRPGRDHAARRGRRHERAAPGVPRRHRRRGRRALDPAGAPCRDQRGAVGVPRRHPVSRRL